MKRTLSFVLSLVMVFSVLVNVPVTVNAATIDALTFELNEEGTGYTVTDCKSTARGSVEIPATYNDLPVTGIGSSAFTECSRITSVSIPNSVTSIADMAFKYCFSLEAVEIPDSVKTMGDGVFTECDALSSVSLPEVITRIGEDTFRMCQQLKEINFPSSITEIGAGAFSYCGFTSLTLNDGLKIIGNDAFRGCKKLKTVVISESVTDIKGSAFSSCKKLENIVIPAGVTNIGVDAFGSCEALTEINVVDENTFYASEDGVLFNKDKTAVIQYPVGKADASYELPKGLTVIGESAFKKCSKLESVIIPEGVTSIGNLAFSDCLSLVQINIPDGVTRIGDYAFQFCEGLSSIEIPDSVTFLGEYAFDSCTGIKEVTIQGGLEEIGEGAFVYCENLEKITLPDSLVDIGSVAFEGCKKLTSIEIPAGVEYIGKNAFYNCPEIKSVKIPCSTETIGEYALGFYYDELTYKVTVVDGFVLYGVKGSPAEAYAISNGITFAELKDACTHSQSIWIIDEYSDCQNVGSKHKECSYCGENIETAVIDKEEHIISNWIIEKAPTCSESGSRFKECTECREVLEREEITKKEHTPSGWKTDKKATVNAAGSKHKECTECGEILKTATIKQLKCSKPSLKKIENTKDGVKITWGKVTGADSYVVYRKTGSGSYKKIATVKGNSKVTYTDKSAKSGKKYYYNVKAVNEAGSSETSKAKSILYLADTTLSTPKSTKSGITLKWKKITGADGYYVYRKTGNGSYSKIATVKGNAKVTYTDKSAKKGKKYTYKIKAYKSKTYSAYSNTKTITDMY